MSKAEVIINGIYVDLDDDFSITIEKNSRLTQFDELIDTWAYDLSFPGDDSETNQEAFEHAQRFEKMFISWQEYSFQFYFNGRLLLNGKIRAKYKSGKYKGYAFGAFGAMASSDLSKNLNELSFPELTFTNKAEYTPGTDPYCLFPMLNYDYYKREGFSGPVLDGEGYYNIYQYYWQVEQEYKQNKFDTVNNRFVTSNNGGSRYSAITPFMFAGWLVEQIFSVFNIKTSTNILNTDVLLKQACIYTTYDIHTINPIDWSDDGMTWVDLEEITISHFISTKSIGNFNPANLMSSDWSVYDYLLGLQNILNVLFDFSDSRAEARVLDREAIYKGPATDINDKLLATPELEPEKSKKVILKFGVDSNDAQWSEKDAIASIGFIALDDEQRSREKEEVATRILLEALTTQEMGEIRYVLSEKAYFEWQKRERFENGKNQEYVAWVDLSHYGQDLHIGTTEDTELTIESKFGVICAKPTDTALLVGNGDDFKNDPKPFLPRIMLYQGLNNGVPYAPSMGGSMDLNWRGTNGLYEKRWKHTVKAIKDGVKGFAQFDFDEVDFEVLNLNQKFRIEEGSFIIEKSTTTFTSNEVEPTQADILKLP